jgi:hypothetical protein
VTVFWRAYAWIAIPIVALSIVSTVAAVGVSSSVFWLGFYLVFGAAGVWLVAIVALYARGTRESASEIIIKALAWTVIPSVALSFVSAAGAAVGVSDSVYWPGFYIVWYVTVGGWLLATMAMVARYARGARESASGILKPFTWTAIPIVSLSIVSTVGAEYGVTGDKFWLGFYVVWYVAAGGWLAMTMATAVLYARGKRESALGVLAGVGVGVLAVGTTGLVNFATIVATFR